MDKVLFYWTPVYPYNYPDDKHIIAFMPDAPANPGTIMSYMHIGQHGEARLAFMQDCTPATPEDYRNLKDELISIGYELEDE